MDMADGIALEELAYYLFLSIVVGGAALITWIRSNRRDAILRHLQNLGFQRVEPHVWTLDKGGVVLTARLILGGKRGDEPQRWVLEGPLQQHVPLKLTPQGLTFDLTLGDKDFDDHVTLTDFRPPEGWSWLSRDARVASVTAIKAGATFSDHRWIAQSVPTSKDELTALLRAIREASAAFNPDRRRVLDRLLQIAQGDRSPDVRLKAFDALLPYGDEATTAFRAALGSPTWSLRFMAAKHLHEPATMKKLVAEGPRTWRTRAAAWLLERGEGRDIAEAALVDAVVDNELGAEAADALARWGSASTAATLAGATGSHALRARAGILARHSDAVGHLSLAVMAGGDLGLVPDADPER